MTSQTLAIVQHVDHPEWGRGLVLPRQDGRTDRFDIAFESGGQRTILKSFAQKLTEVVLPAEEAKALGERLSNRRAATRSPAKKAKPAVAPAFATFEAQLASFLEAFPGGFSGEQFQREVRGLPEAKRKKSHTAPAILEAAAALGAQSFAEHDDAWIFEAAAKLVKDTAFVHPLEGASLIGVMPEEGRAGFVAALRELLHGAGPADERFERFVSAAALTDGKGASRRATWPLATVFAALVHPTEHVCVKPTAFQKQAALMKVALDYQPQPTAPVYAQFLAMARLTEEALRAAGQAPADLVDVASFIALTQGAKAAKSV